MAMWQQGGGGLKNIRPEHIENLPDDLRDVHHRIPTRGKPSIFSLMAYPMASISDSSHHMGNSSLGTQGT